MTFSRRTALKAAFGAAGGSAASRFVGLQESASAQRSPSTESSGVRLILLGTQGGPNYTATRGESANALLVNERPYLVDCGYGTLAALKKAAINHRQIAQVFISHLHDDHTVDLAALLIRQWTDGRVEPTTVIGPVRHREDGRSNHCFRGGQRRHSPRGRGAQREARRHVQRTRHRRHVVAGRSVPG